MLFDSSKEDWMILPLTDWPEFTSWWLLCFGISAIEEGGEKRCWIHCSQTSHDAVDQSPCPCFCLAAVWPENLEVLYQHPHHRSVTPISVNTLTAEADSHTSTPPVPFSSISLHTPTSPRAYTNFEEAGRGGGRGAVEEGKGQLWISICFHFREPQNPGQNWSPVLSPWGDLITYKFMKEELFAVLTYTLCIYNIMLGLGKEGAHWCN